MTSAAIVLHYRSWPQVRDTVDGLLGQAVAPDEVVVVDNCSGDGSVQQLRRAFPSVTVIEAPSNRGYGAGMNLGIRTVTDRSSPAVLFLLTHECRLAPDALAVLAGRLDEDHGVGVVGPLLGYLDEPGRVFSAGGCFEPRRWRQEHLDNGAAMAGVSGGPPRAVDWLDGAALAIRTEAWSAAGPFDEKYFLYFEETELSCRVRHAGWRIECVPDAIAWQQPGGRDERLMTRNRMRFLARNGPRVVFARELVRVGAQTTRPKHWGKESIRQRRLGLVDFLRRRHGALPGERH